MNKILKKLVQNRLGKIILSNIPSYFLYPGNPTMINLELTNICNLKCALCPYNKMKRKKEFMNLEKYKKLIDELSIMKPFIYLSAWGDSLLHPNIAKMVKYANDKGIETMISSNLSMVLSDNQIDDLVNSGLNILIVGLDGATKESYEKYRIKGNFNIVVKNIKRIAEAKKKFKTETPKITAGFLVMRHNENEMKDVAILSGKIGVDELDYKPAVLGLGAVTNKEEKFEKQKLAKEFLPKNEGYSNYKYNKNYDLKLPAEICPFIKQAAIACNGDMMLCCKDYESSVVIGNVFEEGFINLWKSKRYKKFRKQIIKRQFPVCKNCENGNFQINKKIIFKR